MHYNAKEATLPGPECIVLQDTCIQLYNMLMTNSHAAWDVLQDACMSSVTKYVQCLAARLAVPQQVHFFYFATEHQGMVYILTTMHYLI